MTDKKGNKMHSGAQAKPVSRQVKSIFTYIFSDELKEKVSKEIITVPNEALSIQEILSRHSKGIQSFTPKPGQYMDTEDYDSEDMEKLGNVDILEIHEAQEEAEAIATAIKNPPQKEVEQSEEKTEDSEKKEAQTTNDKGDQITE